MPFIVNKEKENNQLKIIRKNIIQKCRKDFEDNGYYVDEENWFFRKKIVVNEEKLKIRKEKQRYTHILKQAKFKTKA
jgi:hypothetical protein